MYLWYVYQPSQSDRSKKGKKDPTMAAVVAPSVSKEKESKKERRERTKSSSRVRGSGARARNLSSCSTASTQVFLHQRQPLILTTTANSTHSLLIARCMVARSDTRIRHAAACARWRWRISLISRWVMRSARRVKVNRKRSPYNRHSQRTCKFLARIWPDHDLRLLALASRRTRALSLALCTGSRTRRKSSQFCPPTEPSVNLRAHHH